MFEYDEFSSRRPIAVKELLLLVIIMLLSIVGFLTLFKMFISPVSAAVLDIGKASSGSDLVVYPAPVVLSDYEKNVLLVARVDVVDGLASKYASLYDSCKNR